MSAAVVLFTRDLRVHDNVALHYAAERHERVVPLFVLDDAILGGRFASANRVAFLLDALHDLSARLSALGAPLVVRRGDTVAATANVAAAAGATRVYLARDVSAYAQRRETRLRHERGFDVCAVPSVTIVST